MGIPRVRNALALINLISIYSYAFATPTPDLIYKVTNRDFLPAACMFKFSLTDEFNSAWGVVNISKDSNECYSGNSWDSFFNDKTIQGHPDFNTERFPDNEGPIEDGIQCNNPQGIPVKSCVYGGIGGANAFRPLAGIAGEYIEVAPSGVPKAPYCSETQRCGCRRETCTTHFLQSNKTYYDSWFNDDPQFNRRVGNRLPTFKTGDIFKYDSRADNENFDFVDNEGQQVQRDNYGPLDRFKGSTGNPEYAEFVELITAKTPDQVAAWPQSLTSSLRHVGFWLTTELHTFFTFRETGTMTFTFSGDDDFWAYVNGRMVIDLGGIHPRRDASVNLLDYVDELNLTDGEIYTLDIFHAERQTSASNFEIQTSLTPDCTVENTDAGTLSFNTTSMDTEEFEETFKSTELVTYFGNGAFSLTDSSESSINYIYSRIQQNVGRGFKTTFTVQISGETDGFAFVIQDFGLVNIPLSGFPFLGLKNINGLFAVVFDLCKRNTLADSCDGEEVSVHFSNQTDTGIVPFEDSKKVYEPITARRKLISNDEIFVEIIFYNKPDFLEVYIDNSLYLRQSNFNLAEVIGSSGAHVGLSATTSNKASNITVSNWELVTIEVETNFTVLGEDALDTDISIADGVTPSAGFTFITFDGCGTPLDSGTLDGLFSVYYVESEPVNGTQAVVRGEIVDNENGTYTAQLVTDIATEYDAYFAFGDGCEVIIDESVSPVLVTLPSEDECFVGSITNASLVQPLPPVTEAPTIFIDLEDDNSQLVKIASSIGSVLGFGTLVAGVLIVVYKRRWLRDKVFVSDGKRYLAEVNTELNSADEITKVTNQVMQTNQQLLRFENMAEANSRQKEIMELENQNRALQEEARMKQKELQQMDGGQESSRAKRNKKIKKMDFDSML